MNKPEYRNYKKSEPIFNGLKHLVKDFDFSRNTFIVSPYWFKSISDTVMSVLRCLAKNASLSL